MAVLADISAALTNEFQPKVTRTINRKSMAVRLLSIKRGYGQATTWAVESNGAEATAGPAVEGADITTFAADQRVPASLGWGDYQAAVKQSGLALAAAASTVNPADLEALLERDFENAANALAQQLNRDFYVQNVGAGGSLPIQAYTTAASITGSYAGISRASQPLWRGVVAANGGTARPLSLALMRSVRRQLYVNGEPPDLIVTDPIQYDNYGALMDPQRRWVDNIRLDKGTIKLDAGFQALEFEGVPLIKDKDCPPGTMFFVHTPTLYWKYLPDATVPGFPQLAERVAEGDEKEPASLPVAVVALGRSGDSARGFLKAYPQLVCERPNLHGVLVDLQ